MVAIVSFSQFFKLAQHVSPQPQSIAIFIPVSNGKLERIFSVLKLIKVDRRSSLGNDTLKDLLTLNIDGRSMENFNPDPCIDLWWQAKTQRPDQKKRKVYKKRAEETIESETDSSSDDDDVFLLDDWDNWLDDN